MEIVLIKVKIMSMMWNVLIRLKLAAISFLPSWNPVFSNSMLQDKNGLSSQPLLLAQCWASLVCWFRLSAKISPVPDFMICVLLTLHFASLALNSPPKILNLFLSLFSLVNEGYHLPTIYSNKIPTRHPWLPFTSCTPDLTYIHIS